MIKTSVYINTWGRYNEGLSGSGWLDLGMTDSEDFAKMLKSKVKDHDPEYFIQDYEGLELEEGSDFLELNDILFNMDEGSEDMFEAVIEYEGLAQAIEGLENGFNDYILYSGVEDEDDLGHIMLECYVIPKGLEDYIDYKEAGRIFTEDGGQFVDAGYILSI